MEFYHANSENVNPFRVSPLPPPFFAVCVGEEAYIEEDSIKILHISSKEKPRFFDFLRLLHTERRFVVKFKKKVLNSFGYEVNNMQKQNAEKQKANLSHPMCSNFVKMCKILTKKISHGVHNVGLLFFSCLNQNL